VKVAAAVAGIVAVMGLTFVITTEAQAFYGWHWKESKTERYIVQKRWTSDGYDLLSASCEGRGPRWQGKYARFMCWSVDELDREFRLVVRPISAYRARVVEWACDDYDSEYACP
jgi:hypothetical protein